MTAPTKIDCDSIQQRLEHLTSLRIAKAISLQRVPMTFTIRASKDGQTIETVREGPTATVAKARGLFKTGWLVQIIDSDGLTYAPSEFDQLLGFDRHKRQKPKEISSDGVLSIVENILAERPERS
jgi:hypothetical protein